MIEVAAALSAATTAFNAIKKGFEVGPRYRIHVWGFKSLDGFGI